jgi:DNA-binding response OmpR family regulator
LCAVLLDVMLPLIDGVSLLRQMRAHGPAVPVVAMSASEEYLLAAVTAGARGAVAKPFDIDHLVDVVRRACV